MTIANFGIIFGAVTGGTACVLSVYNTIIARQQNRVRFRVSLSYGIYEYGSGAEPVVILKVANLSNRPLKVTSPSILLPEGKYRQLMMQPGNSQSIHPMPAEMPSMDSIEITMSVFHLVDALKTQGIVGATKLRGRIFDQVGGVYDSKFMQFSTTGWAR